jgi:hypothetical protein
MPVSATSSLTPSLSSYLLPSAPSPYNPVGMCGQRCELSSRSGRSRVFKIFLVHEELQTGALKIFAHMSSLKSSSTETTERVFISRHTTIVCCRLMMNGFRAFLHALYTDDVSVAAKSCGVPPSHLFDHGGDPFIAL